MAFETRQFGELFAEPPRNGINRPKAVRGEGVKMVNMGELFAHPRLNNAPMDRVPLVEPELGRFLLSNGDLLFARQSLVLEGAGQCSIFLQDDEPVTFESHVTRVRLAPELADPVFYFYYLQSHHGRAAIRSIVEQGAGASGIRGSDLNTLNVLWCPLTEQRNFAKILGTLDDKFELNKGMHETLEAMIRALFKSWFVDFDPVSAKAEGRSTGLPKPIAELFPDSFEDSELSGVPKGWAVGKFADIAVNHRRSVSHDQIPEQTPYIALEHMPKHCIALSNWGTADRVESGKSFFKTNEILFGKLRPYFHKVGIAPVDGVCSTDILVIAPFLPEWFGFALGHASSSAFVEHTSASSTGTKMPRTSWNELARYPVVLPPPQIAKVFNDLIQPICNSIIASIHESRSLLSTRDALIPKLIPGEIGLAAHEHAAGEVC
jgi:type I restriction enzyme S subunit